jgi:hypothetical protein
VLIEETVLDEEIEQRFLEFLILTPLARDFDICTGTIS